MKKYVLLLIAAIFFLNSNVVAQKERAVWSKEKAAAWYSKEGWGVAATLHQVLPLTS